MLRETNIPGLLRVNTKVDWPEEPENCELVKYENRAVLVDSKLVFLDWEYTPYKSNESILLNDGDLVRVFNTVSKGEILWKGEIDFEYERSRATNEHGFTKQAIEGFWVNGTQKDLDPLLWFKMFENGLPARLEKNGKVIFGSLEPFSETGTEGIVWSVDEYGKSGYDSLNMLEKGDLLTVYSSVSEGDLEWKGRVHFRRSSDPVKIGGVHQTRNIPEHMNPDRWLQMCFDNRPVLVTPCPK